MTVAWRVGAEPRPGFPVALNNEDLADENFSVEKDVAAGSLAVMSAGSFFCAGAKGVLMRLAMTAHAAGAQPPSRRPRVTPRRAQESGEDSSSGRSSTIAPPPESSRKGRPKSPLRASRRTTHQRCVSPGNVKKAGPGRRAAIEKH